MKRVLTALVLLLVAFYTLFFGSQELFMAVAVALAALCYHEFISIAQHHGVKGPLWIGHITGALYFFLPNSIRLSVVVCLLVALAMRELPKGLAYAGSVLLGILYTYGGWRSAVDLRSVSTNWVLFALAVNWIGDIAAFYIGRRFGRHKLFPRVSPGKSWEGAIASVISAVAFGFVMVQQGWLRVPMAEMLMLSALASIGGQLGDLAESALKRGAGMKDSGTLLPGHGGFLDRLDSSLFTMPIVYSYLMYRGYFLP